MYHPEVISRRKKRCNKTHITSQNGATFAAFERPLSQQKRTNFTLCARRWGRHCIVTTRGERRRRRMASTVHVVVNVWKKFAMVERGGLVLRHRTMDKRTSLAPATEASGPRRWRKPAKILCRQLNKMAAAIRPTLPSPVRQKKASAHASWRTFARATRKFAEKCNNLSLGLSILQLHTRNCR